MKVNKKYEVSVKNLKYDLTKANLPELFIKSRCRGKQGTVDSPIYCTFNSLWLVRHTHFKTYRGFHISFYAIYHEDELEIISIPSELPTTATNINSEDSMSDIDWMGGE